MIVYLISLLVIGSAIAWSLWKAPSDKELWGADVLELSGPILLAELQLARMKKTFCPPEETFISDFGVFSFTVNKEYKNRDYSTFLNSLYFVHQFAYTIVLFKPTRVANFISD